MEDEKLKNVKNLKTSLDYQDESQNETQREVHLNETKFNLFTLVLEL